MLPPWLLVTQNIPQKRFEVQRNRICYQRSNISPFLIFIDNFGYGKIDVTILTIFVFLMIFHPCLKKRRRFLQPPPERRLFLEHSVNLISTRYAEGFIEHTCVRFYRVLRQVKLNGNFFSALVVEYSFENIHLPCGENGILGERVKNRFFFSALVILSTIMIGAFSSTMTGLGTSFL